MPELKLYTVAQLREWLMHNHAAEGLSEYVIAPTRAWAILHNPYVKDDDPIVAAIFVDGRLGAYTASFPEQIERQRIWWCSTLYCFPQFAGRGFGMIVVGSLMEAHEPDLTYDRWGAKETVEICDHLGLQTTYTPRYHLSFKKIDASSLKGKIAYGIRSLQCCLHPWPKLSKANYTLRYASYIDGEAYTFMQAHHGVDLWLREQDMLNWMLRYPFRQSCSVMQRVEKDLNFTSYISSFDYKVIKVYLGEQLIGVYVLRQCDNVFSVVYLYYAEDNRDDVFSSIVDHIVALKPKAFVTENPDLLAYIRERVYFPKMQEEKVSFSLPNNRQLPSEFTFQLGDGDSFV